MDPSDATPIPTMPNKAPVRGAFHINSESVGLMYAKQEAPAIVLNDRPMANGKIVGDAAFAKATTGAMMSPMLAHNVA